MTIWDAIEQEFNKTPFDMNKRIAVSCLIYGEGWVYEFDDRQDISFVRSHPIWVNFGDFHEEYTVTGKFQMWDKYPLLALGHFGDQLAIAQAIKDQNFETEGL